MKNDEEGAKQPNGRKPTEFTMITCEFDSAGSTRCAKCNARSDPCDQVPDLLTGNARDVVLLTAYANGLINEEEDETDSESEADGTDAEPEADGPIAYLFSVQSRRRIVAAVYDLRVAFSAIMTQHSKEHSLIGTKAKTKAADAAYRDYCLQRRRLNTIQNGACPLDPNSPQHQLWMENSILRLAPGDGMYRAWLVALEAFEDAIAAVFAGEDGLNEDWCVYRIGQLPVRTPRL
ncbi:hypothetical protein NM208_g7154 [Fusarium decemcellulare]|uniref:Uncharacterized protein n=1 Tax=Fusarium decemcellulare TaxID=57161 RepID=A0ACC1SA70_9HYPO|nr:hypothetical protein NM208_g7154 [Fusarium decemcellulare]